MEVIAFDTETHLIGPGRVVPKLVCITWTEDGKSYGLGTGDDELKETIGDLLLRASRGRVTLVAHNAAFDMAVLLNAFPEFDELIFEAYARGNVLCTALREKLLVLSDTGNLEAMMLPDGSASRISYSLASLVMRYFGEDLSASKTEEDAWRLRYNELDGKPFADYPKEARDYALQDAVWARRVFDAQQERSRPEGPLSLGPQGFRAAVAFVLQLITARGFRIDLEARDRLKLELEELLSDKRMRPLTSAGILRAGTPPRPHVRHMQRAKDLMAEYHPEVAIEKVFWKKYEDFLMTFGISLTQPVRSSIDTSKLHSRIVQVCQKHGIDVKRNPPTEKCPEGTVKADRAALAELIGLDPVLDTYIERQALQKLVSTELPAMSGRIVYPQFDPLKASGRISSYGNSKSRKPLFPSTNIQQKDPRVRHCYVSRPGMALVSCDYDYLELCSLAWKQKQLFGTSALADVINSGKDPHAFFGARLALHLHSEFRDAAKQALGETADYDKLYDFFVALKRSDNPELVEIYEKFRKFAKPTGLGYPGGLGPRTFITYAKATYNLDLVELQGSFEAASELATTLREIWFETFPEAKASFDWITSKCVDDRNSKDDTTYAYTSPLGMYRAGCFFTSAANGAFLQTPAAEGFMKALWEVMRECYDYSRQSLLYGSASVLAPIHDEIIAEIPIDEHLHDRAMRIAEIMRREMSGILEGVRIGVEPVAMLKWDKRAKPTFDPQGKLIPWEP